MYNIIKAETSLFPYYTYLYNNNILVTNTPIMINIPTNIDIPLNGCSIPVNISLNNPPYTDITI